MRISMRQRLVNLIQLRVVGRHGSIEKIKIVQSLCCPLIKSTLTIRNNVTKYISTLQSDYYKLKTIKKRCYFGSVPKKEKSPRWITFSSDYLSVGLSVTTIFLKN